jgi:hypothetical protein
MLAVMVIALFGVLLPATALGVELATGLCAGTLFDPIPTPWHVAVVAAVPLANLLAIPGGMGLFGRSRSLLLWVNAFAVGVSLVYTLVFLPLVPVGLIGVLVAGIGLLPLAPLAALLAGLVARRRLRRVPALRADAPVPGTVPGRGSLVLGAALGILVLASLEVPIVVTRLTLERAISGSPDERTEAVRLLRRLGNQDQLLRACYSSSSGWFSRVDSASQPFSQAEARKVFYRVTGFTYDTFPRPRSLQTPRLPWLHSGGGTDQADVGLLEGFRLVGSRIDATVMPEQSAAYLEWTLVAQSVQRQPREAWAEIQLPPGGVVCHVTASANGQPQESVFDTPYWVRDDYRLAVADQGGYVVLVTWVGPDRVLVRWLPGESRDGLTKVGLGIAAPLILEDKQQANLRLPCLAACNFRIADQRPHAVWVESSGPIQSAVDGLAAETPEGGTHVLRGLLTDTDLGWPISTIRVQRPQDAVTAWASDPHSSRHVIVQKVVEAAPARPGRIVIVVDGSLGLSHLDEIARVLAALPGQVDLQIVAAGDQVVHLTDVAAKRSAEDPGPIRRALRETNVVGGCDNVPALTDAWERAAAGHPGAILWIHGPQPVLLEPVEQLLQRLANRPDAVVVHDFQIGPGPNRVAEGLGPIAALRTVPRLATTEDDLQRILNLLTGKPEAAKPLEVQRKRVPVDEAPAVSEGSGRLACLWAFDRVLELVRTDAPAARSDAGHVGTQYMIVSPTSGAVVQESPKRLDEPDFEPSTPETLPEDGTKGRTVSLPRR